MAQRVARAKKSPTSRRPLAVEPGTGTKTTTSKPTKAERATSTLARREAGAIEKPARKQVQARRAGKLAGKTSKSEFLRWWKTLSKVERAALVAAGSVSIAALGGATAMFLVSASAITVTVGGLSVVISKAVAGSST